MEWAVSTKGVFLLTYSEAPMEDLEILFNELKNYYAKEKQNFNFKFSNHDDKNMKDYVYYIAYNLSKNIMHGPLPNHLHTRMVLDNNHWSKKYIEYLEGKT